MRLSRKRKAIAAGVALVGVTAIAVPVSLAMADTTATNPKNKSTCEIQRLTGPKGNKEGSVEAVSPDGEYLAGEVDGKTGVWHDGAFIALGKPDLSVVDVNDDGVATGFGQDDSAQEGPWTWKWSTEKFANLKLPKGTTNDNANVVGIDAAGDVVGNAGTSIDDEFLPDTPLKWKAGSTEPTQLKLTRDKGVANDISSDGRIVGAQHNGDEGKNVPWLWTDAAAGKQLPKVPGVDNDYVEATGISGDFVTSSGAGDSYDTYVWNLADGSVSKKPFGMVDPAGVSDNGKLAYGADEDMEDDYDTSYAVIETAQGIKHLPLLVDEDDLGNNTNAVRSASQDGSLLAGDSWDKTTKHNRAVVWTGCSDPS